MNRLTLERLTRWAFLRVCAMVLAALSAGAVCANDETGSQKKNVLLIYVDDLRPELNCYGQSKMISPNIDKLAARSLVFNRAYCQVPICMPSRVSTLSGMYARSTAQGKLRLLLPKGKPSLPGHFKAHGYDTVSIGKVYHFNNDDPDSWTKRYTDTFHETKYVCDGWCSGYQLEKNREAVRVPFMIAAPGITKGDKTDALGELVDIYPTLCELTGLSIPEHVEGMSMVPLLADPSRKWKTAAFNVWQGSMSMRTDRYRLTRYNKAMPKGNRNQLPSTTRYELYDYETDPAGNENIAVDRKNRELLDQLIAQMNAGWKAARPNIE